MGGDNGVTPASQWGASNHDVVELPSGEKARLLNKLNVWTLVRRGVMTDDLLAAYAKAEAGELENLDQAVELNDLILVEMFLEPKVYVPSGEQGDEQPEGTVHVDQITDDDVTFVLERAFRGAREVSRFRGDGDGDDAGGNGEDVGDDAVGDGGSGDGKPAGVPAGQASRGAARRTRPPGKKAGKSAKPRARSKT